MVPLSRQAVNLFQALREYTGHGSLVFPGAISATRCITGECLLNALRRMGYARGVMTIHGFRTTASTMLNQQGFNRDWIERQLAHAEKNAIRDAYNRAEWLDDRARMMQAWADYLDGLRTGTNGQCSK